MLYGDSLSLSLYKCYHSLNYMVISLLWHLGGNPNLVWNPARLMKEGGCVDLSVDTMHIKDPMVLFGFEGFSLSLFLFSFFHLELICFVIVLQQ